MDSQYGLDTEHKPSPPSVLNNNIWLDVAGYSIDMSKERICTLIPNSFGYVGELTWLCPVRWSILNPGSAFKNSYLPYDGVLPDRTQKTYVRVPEEGETRLEIIVDKLF